MPPSYEIGLEALLYSYGNVSLVFIKQQALYTAAIHSEIKAQVFPQRRFPQKMHCCVQIRAGSNRGLKLNHRKKPSVVVNKTSGSAFLEYAKRD